MNLCNLICNARRPAIWTVEEQVDEEREGPETIMRVMHTRTTARQSIIMVNPMSNFFALHIITVARGPPPENQMPSARSSGLIKSRCSNNAYVAAAKERPAWPETE